MDIIALYGAANTGKTATLKLLINHLKFLDKIHELVINENDVLCIYKCNNHIIGVSTIGDASDEINKHLAILVEYKCDIIITATRTGGQTCQAILDFCETHKNTETHWIKKNNIYKTDFHKNTAKKQKESLLNSYNEIDKLLVLEMLSNLLQ